MKNKLYYILLLIYIFSCGESKRTDSHTTNKQKVDTPLVKLSSPKDTTSVKDSLAGNNKYEDNILIKEESKSVYQMKSISELWTQYKDAKLSAAKFISQNNLDSIIYYLDIAANASYELSREDIATWQLNNIGYYSIIEFKSKTDYDNRMQKLASLKNLKERALYSAETKLIFKENYHILLRAENFLYKAQLLDSELEPSDRTKNIEGNIKFIHWIGNYISDSSKINGSNDDE